MHWLAVSGLDLRLNRFKREGRDAILEPGEFIGDVRRQEVAAGRQNLAEFDENRPQRFECQAYPFAAWRSTTRTTAQQTSQRTETAGGFVFKKIRASIP